MTGKQMLCLNSIRLSCLTGNLALSKWMRCVAAISLRIWMTGGFGIWKSQLFGHTVAGPEIVFTE